MIARCQPKTSYATALSLASLWLVLALPHQLFAAGPAPLDLRSTANFVILSGAAITSTGGGGINGDVGASPIAGSAIGVTCAQVNGIIYAVDASGPACAVIDASRLTAAKGDLTTAYNDAAGRTPVPTGPFLNPNGGNIGGLNLVPGLYKFTSTALITGADVTLTGGPDDVWIFQIASDLQLGSGIKVILAGGAQAKNVFWQVGTSAVLGTSSVFKGTILADQAITMNTSSTLEGRALAFSAGVTFNGAGAGLPTAANAPEIAVQQPAGTDLEDGVSSVDFGSVSSGSDTSRTFTITNRGNANLIVSGITIFGPDADQFSLTTVPTVPVSPNGSATFVVRFAPMSSGLKLAALQIENNDSDENPFDISISGTGTTVASPEIAVEQPAGTDLVDGFGSRNFGSVLVGTNTSLTFTVRNLGGANLTGLGVTIDGADAAQFSVTANPTATVTPSGSTTFTVRFAPTSAGLKTAALHIASNDGNENPFDITLTGTGTTVATPEIAVEQPAGTDLVDGVSNVDFGSVSIGSDTSRTFTITNRGNANLSVSSITLVGPASDQFSLTTVPTAPISPNGSATFVVRFAPMSSGLKLAALQIANNDSDENPFDITISGTGTTVSAPEIVVEQPLGTDMVDAVGSRNFGSLVVGDNTSLTFTIRNVGSANLTGLSVTIDGADAAQFSVTANPNAPVAPGGSTTFTVRFAPTSAGLKTAALHIANNDSNENPFDITLMGTGFDGGFVVTTNVTVSATSPIALNPQTGLFEQTVQLINNGPNSVNGLRLRILNLPADVQVYNASGSANGTPFVQYDLPLAGGATVDLLIEYYRANRQAIPPPGFVVEVTSRVAVTETGPVLQIDRNVPLAGGRFLIEFSSTPGRRYAVQYSTDNMQTWKTANPSITAPANRVQWYDDGPPKTESKPTSIGSRFYRVMELP